MAALMLLAGTNIATAQTAADFQPYQPSSLRLPSVPLFVNDPYFSLWSPFDKLNDGTTRHWSDAEKAMDGLLRVDGKAYRFMGRQRTNLLKAIAPMSTGESGWTAKVNYNRQTGTGWTALDFDDSTWATEDAAWGTANEYPNCRHNWSAQNSDIYIRRSVDLTADDLQKELWIQFSHDDVFELFINGRRIIATGETWLQGETHRLTTAEKACLKEGTNMIAAHCHNTTGGAYVDFGLYENMLIAPTGVENAVQTAVDVLATSTYYTFTCGPVELKVVFTAPMLMDDLDLLSTPINYLSYQVTSTDGQAHDVQFYFATTPQLTVDQMNQSTRSERISAGGINYLKAGSVAQPVLGKAGDLITIDWGYLYLPDVNGTVSMNDAAQMESYFCSTGKLMDYEGPMSSIDAASMPTLAYMKDFGKVREGRSFMMIGYDEVKDIRYMNQDYKGYWARNGKTITQAFQELRDGYADIMARCRQQDKIIYDDGLAAGNTKYAELLSGSYRHVIAAHKLFEDKDHKLLFFSKENNSNGCVNTVDLTYPEAPLFLCYNPELQKAMMTSIFEYSYSGRWTKPFAAHDLGQYPKANGQVYGGDMPLEEAGNMITLAAMLCLIDGNTGYVDKYWDIITTWANYLSDNGQDPTNQLCTDDFAGHWAHNTNLSVKAIMGVAGYALMAQLKGLDDVYNKYMNRAREMAVKWEQDAREGDHYRLAFDRPDTWSQKYNMVWDKLWKLNLFPNGAMEREVKYYLTKQNRYGLPLDIRRDYTKSDWIMWTAAMSKDKKTFVKFVEPLYNYMNETESRVPTSDWYDTKTAQMVGFKARSVIAGHWMRVLAEKLN